VFTVVTYIFVLIVLLIQFDDYTQELKAIKIPLTTKLYNITIRACDKGGEWRKAKPIVDMMKYDGIEPDEVTYNRCCYSYYCSYTCTP
jgi:hypothetical protein